MGDIERRLRKIEASLEPPGWHIQVVWSDDELEPEPDRVTIWLTWEPQ